MFSQGAMIPLRIVLGELAKARQAGGKGVRRGCSTQRALGSGIPGDKLRVWTTKDFAVPLPSLWQEHTDMNCGCANLGLEQMALKPHGWAGMKSK